MSQHESNEKANFASIANGALTITVVRIKPFWWKGTGRRGLYFAPTRGRLIQKIAEHEQLDAVVEDLTPPPPQVDERRDHMRKIIEEARAEALAFTDARARC